MVGTVILELNALYSITALNFDYSTDRIFFMDHLSKKLYSCNFDGTGLVMSTEKPLIHNDKFVHAIQPFGNRLFVVSSPMGQRQLLNILAGQKNSMAIEMFKMNPNKLEDGYIRVDNTNHDFELVMPVEGKRFIHPGNLFIKDLLYYPSNPKSADSITVRSRF